MNAGLSTTPEAADALSSRASACARLASRVLLIKQRLVERYSSQGLPMPLIRDAIAAAEADAWLSGFPHLFLPDLAEEIIRRRLANPAVKHPAAQPDYAQAA